MSLPKRKILELQAIGQLSSIAHDVFVEGSGDRIFIASYLYDKKVPRFQVYEIEHFEIDPAEVRGRGLEDNNRGRVITLAHKLEHAALGGTCIADTDFDAVLGITYKCTNLLFTDYTTIEMYGFNEPVLRKLLNFFVCDATIQIAKIMEQLSAVLQELFLIRLANRNLGLHLTSVKWQKSCKYDRGKIVFDIADHIKRLLNANGKMRQLGGFTAEMQRCREALKEDCRLQIHGHDFISLLSWFIREAGGEHVPGETMQKVLFCSIDPSSLDGEQLFQRLVARLVE